MTLLPQFANDPTATSRRVETNRGSCGSSFLLILCLLVLLTPGCGGCLKKPADTDDKQTSESDEPKKPKPDFETKPMVYYPGVFEKEQISNRAKPGHWNYGVYRAQANNYDAGGQMYAHPVNASGRVLPVPGTDFYSETTRPFSLPKEQSKNLETLVFFPKRPTTTAQLSGNIQFRLMGSSGLPLIETNEPVTFLKPFQYHFVVLAKDMDSYKFLSFLDCIKLPTLGFQDYPNLYHLVRPTAGHNVPLGRSALTWTTIAYLLWDDFDPDSLDTEQQQSLIDWLHFGGQLIVSGPNSLGTLQQSFLGPYLPASAGDSLNLSADNFAELNEHWSIPKMKAPNQKWDLNIAESTPCIGIDLQLKDQAKFVENTGELVAETRVGRGRIVVTSFPLNEGRLKKWESFPSFFHNALLGKPHRKFAQGSAADVVYHFPDQGDSFLSPMLASTLRFISRDLGSDTKIDTSALSRWIQNIELSDISSPWNRSNGKELGFATMGSADPAVDPVHYGGFGFDSQGGTGTWNDETGIALAARENITRVAGINPPDRTFVLKMLGVYLLVLVPLNWLIFRLIGRVEWAWVAIPLIAIVGAGTVVRMASLDIGFVRSQSQIGILEIPKGHTRGHLTQFSALYSSLSTSYGIEFESQDGLALPFAGKGGRPSTTGQTLIPVHQDRTSKNRMENFLVRSNSTGILHEEMLVDLAGQVQLSDDGLRVQNLSRLTLDDVGLVRKSQGRFEMAWIGKLTAGGETEFKWSSTPLATLYDIWIERSENFASTDRKCKAIWDPIAQRRPTIPASELLAAEPLAPWKTALDASFRTNDNSLQNSGNQERFVSYDDFLDRYNRICRTKNEHLNIGNIFDAIANYLVLAEGDVRLLAFTDQPLTKNQLSPKPTQNRFATLVLVHLNYSPFAKAQPDKNTIFDFISKSDLDQKLLNELDELDDEIDDPNSMNEGESTGDADDNSDGNQAQDGQE